jgi:hypothetical protein
MEEKHHRENAEKFETPKSLYPEELFASEIQKIESISKIQR